MATQSSIRRSIVLFLGGVDSEGGMFNYLKCWISESKKNYKKVFVIATPEVCTKIKLEVDGIISLPYSENVGVKNIYINFTLGKYSENMNQIMTKVEMINPDLIHIVDETIYFPFLRGLFKKRNLRVTVHDPIHHKGQFRSNLTRMAVAVGRLSYWMTGNLTLHVHGRRSIRYSYLKNYPRIHFEAHPLPVKRYESSFNDIPVIAFMGRITEYKGFNLFIHSLEVLWSEMPNRFSIKICGSGEIDYTKLKDFGGSVFVKNEFLTNEDFEKELSSIDILCLPYTQGTQTGIGYLAKSYGKAILCTNVGDLPDLIIDYEKSALVKPCVKEIVIGLKGLIEKHESSNI